MSHAKALYKRLKAVPKLTEMFPLLYISGQHTVIANDGSHIAVIALDGLDYTGMRDEQFQSLFNIRKRLFEKESPFYRLDVVSRKFRTFAQDKIDTSSKHQVLSMVTRAWQKNFDELYRTKHYITICVNTGGFMSRIGSVVSSDYNIDKQAELDSIITELMAELSDYSPRLLQQEGGELSSFYATQLNGRETYLNAKHWDQTLANQPVEFDAKQNYCTYGSHGDTIYSGWLSFSRYAEEISNQTLERLFKMPYQFNIYQSFTPYPKNSALKLLDDRAKELSNWGGNNSYFSEQLLELFEKVSADKLTMVNHKFCIEVFGESVDELNKNVRVIENALKGDGQTTLYRETRNLEALFWSRFPTLQSYNERGRDLTSENASHLASFNRVGEGFDTCGFGARPVTLFKTEEGGQYSFTFHQTGEQKPDILGHTLVIGGTGSGKTTLISFLIANCLTYKNFKAICFDRLSGLRVFTEIFDGDYLDFPEQVEMNPFQINDTSANRLFLFNWLKRLAKIDESDNRWNSKLNDLINANFTLDKRDRTFENLKVTLGVEGSDFYTMFEQWLPSGSRGQFFNGERDSFSFERDIVTFDATYILDQPEILPHVTDYIFHQIMAKVSSDVIPHVVFFDESPRYFRDAIFAKKMIEVLNEERKKAGVAILAAQNVAQIADLPAGVGEQVITGLAHIICYPEPAATKEHYCDFLGLNESEFEWIKNTDSSTRKVLVKNRSTDSSVILDIGLGNLKTPTYNLLRCFDSSSEAISRLRQLKLSDPVNWRLKYLRN